MYICCPLLSLYTSCLLKNYKSESQSVYVSFVLYSVEGSFPHSRLPFIHFTLSLPSLLFSPLFHAHLSRFPLLTFTIVVLSLPSIHPYHAFLSAFSLFLSSQCLPYIHIMLSCTHFPYSYNMLFFLPYIHIMLSFSSFSPSSSWQCLSYIHNITHFPFFNTSRVSYFSTFKPP